MATITATSTWFQLILSTTESNVNVANNTSVVNWTLKLKCTMSQYDHPSYISTISGKTGTAAQYFRVLINGAEVYKADKAWGTVTGGQSTTIATGTRTITHDSDGGKSIPIYCEFWRTSGDYPYYPNNMGASGSMALTKIARKSSVTWPNVDELVLGQEYSLTINPAMNTGHLLWANLNGIELTDTSDRAFNNGFNCINGPINTGTAKTVTFSIPIAFAEKMNTLSGSVTLSLDTYSGTFSTVADRTGGGRTNIGNERRTYTVRIPSYSYETSPAISDATGLSSTYGGFIQGKSILQGSLTICEPLNGTVTQSVYGGKLASATLELDGAQATLTGITAGSGGGRADFSFNVPVTFSGTKQATFTYTDNRGKTGTRTFPVTVLPYDSPKITNFEVYRSTTSGTADESQTNIWLKVNYKVYRLSGQNAVSLTVKKGSTTLSGFPRTITADSGSISQKIDTVDLDAQASYTVTLTDAVSGDTILTKTISAQAATVDFKAGGKGICFGGMATTDTLESYMPLGTNLNKLVSQRERSHLAKIDTGNGYLKILTIKPSADTFNYSCVKFSYHIGAKEHGIETGTVIVQGTGTSTDPNLRALMSNPTAPFYLHKSGTNTWDVYVPKVGWQYAAVYDVQTYQNTPDKKYVTFEYKSERVESLPSGYITPTWEYLNAVYPVGSIKISTSADNPGSTLGGTWEKIEGRMIIGANSTYTVNSTGGEASHVLTIEEMPSHNHMLSSDSSAHSFAWGGSGKTVYAGVSATAGNGSGNNLNTKHGEWSSTWYSGGGAAHNNMPPYYAAYIWRRTA